jgi:8-oxo-dGTP diphosphatase
MTTISRAAATRQVYLQDPAAPTASLVVPSVHVAVRGWGGRLLLVCRCDSGAWELPGGLVDVGETAGGSAVRQTAEDSGVRVLLTGFAGTFTDPSYVTRSPGGEVRQVFALLFRARALGGIPRADLHRTSEAAWVAFADLRDLAIVPPVRAWIDQALDVHADPYLG